MKLGISKSSMAMLAALFAAIVLVGCPPELEPQPEGDAKVHMLLTASENEQASALVRQMDIATKQGPVDVDEIESLMVTVTRISFDGPVQGDERQEEEKEPSEVIVFEGERDVELMDLREVSELISVAEVPVGEYTKIRLHYEDPELWLEGDEEARRDIHRTANGRLFVSETFTLVAHKPNYVVLDFQDLHLVQTGQRDRYVFTPQLRADILVDEHTVTMEGVITYLPEDERWFRLELADRETVDVAYLEDEDEDEDTAVLDWVVEEPPASVGVGALEEGMRVDVHGTLWPGEDAWPEISAFDIDILEHPVEYEGIIMTELDPDDPWFTLELHDGRLVDVSYSDDTLVFDDPGDDPLEVEIDEYLTPGMRVWVYGGLWVDEDGEIESISALDIEILEHPNEEEEE